MNAGEAVGTMLAGLGLFFVGIHMLTNNLRQLTGRRFRRMLEKSTRYPLLSALTGALLGATMQTGSAITFILVGMVGAGMITVERSLPVRLGAAVGTSTMVFVATLDIQVLILFLLGIAGISVSQSSSPRPLFSVVLGGGLLFFGLRMVGSGAADLTEMTWFANTLASVNEAHLVAFILGAVLSVLVQSPQSVAILAIAMTSNDVLSTWTTVAIVYGSNFGGGLSTYLLSSGFKGTPRQIMVFQVLFNVLTGIVLLTLFYAERVGGIPLVHALVTSIEGNVAHQMSFVYLIFNVFGAVMMYTLRRPILSWIEKRWPPARHETLSRLEYLHDHSVDLPDLALDLADKEERRYFELLARHIEALRLPAGEDEREGKEVGRSLNVLHQSIEEALTELGYRVAARDSEQLISLVNRNRLLGSLQSSLIDFGAAVRAARLSPRLLGLTTIVVEAFDAMLSVAIDAFESGDQDELTMIWNSTDNKSDKMRNLRQRFMSGPNELSDVERVDLMALTNGLERSIWVVHEFLGEVLASHRDDGAAASQ